MAEEWESTLLWRIQFKSTMKTIMTFVYEIRNPVRDVRVEVKWWWTSQSSNGELPILCPSCKTTMTEKSMKNVVSRIVKDACITWNIEAKDLQKLLYPNLCLWYCGKQLEVSKAFALWRVCKEWANNEDHRKINHCVSLAYLKRQGTARFLAYFGDEMLIAKIQYQQSESGKWTHSGSQEVGN